MKTTSIIILVFIFAACSQQKQKQSTVVAAVPSEEVSGAGPQVAQDTLSAALVDDEPEVFSNQRFKDVTVKMKDEGEYTVEGKAQVFEANFNWVIEDGHKELKKGYAMTDAGAPEWGSFKFTVSVNRPRNNSTLHLLLFEGSPKDGSRQHELAIPLK